jgi:unsaturated chondroitin disaccharide hydrolase
MSEPRKIERESLEPRLERAFGFAALQVRAMVERDPDFFPIYTRNGRWRHQGEGWTDWCAGFHAGMMWLLAERTGELDWRQHAEHYSRLLEHKQYDREVHDLGFIFLNTYLPWYRSTGDARLHDVLITAGGTLALRYNDRGRYLRSFVAPESLFIDIMMNVPLIFYAAASSGDDRLLRLARAHCETTERTLVRDDGSTAHEGIFDPSTGAFLRQSTHQGLHPDSTWARGLAWSLYGFTTVFGYTGRDRDLAIAANNADCFIARCPESFVPPWDFDVPPGPDRIDDSSAAAIAASGLLDLAAHLEPREPAKAQRYRDASLTILDSLCTDRYLAWTTPGWEGVLKHGVYHFHKKLGVDESVMWGDFFFLEAIVKVLGRPEFPALWN